MLLTRQNDPTEQEWQNSKYFHETYMNDKRSQQLTSNQNLSRKGGSYLDDIDTIRERKVKALVLSLYPERLHGDTSQIVDGNYLTIGSGDMHHASGISQGNLLHFHVYHSSAPVRAEETIGTANIMHGIINMVSILLFILLLFT